MSSYIHFTEEQKQCAAAVNLEEFLRCRGESAFLRQGKTSCQRPQRDRPRQRMV